MVFDFREGEGGKSSWVFKYNKSPFCYMMKLTRQKAIRCNFKEIIDITWISGLSLVIKKEVDDNASILYEM